MTCTWREDSDGNWQTWCGHMFVLIEGCPLENDMAFCPYCGKPITEIGFDDDAEESE